MRTILLLLALTLFHTTALAGELAAVQGEVVRLERQVDHQSASVRAFGKQWPVKVDHTGHATAWIGIDLKTKPGTYTIRWRTPSGWQTSEQLTVSKGNFRISHITVDKKMAEFDKKTLARIRSDQASLRKTYTAKVDARPDISINALPSEGMISTPFGAQRYVNGEPRSPHSGLDIAAPEGTPVRTPLPGKVLLVSEMYLNGNTVVVGHGFGMVSVFCHLQDSQVKEGEWIRQDALIGSIGMSGRATGPHLHWGIRFNEARIDPFSIMNGHNQP